MLRPLSQVPAPGETVYYMEHCGRFVHQAAPLVDDDGACNAADFEGAVYGWHGQAFEFSVAFVDGHVAPTQMRGTRATYIGRYPEHEDPFYGHIQFRCVIFRGPGWRMDTLPAPLVPTGIADFALSQSGREVRLEEAPGLYRIVGEDIR